MRAHMEKLQSEAEYCALISELAVDPRKRVLFASLSRYLKRLASEVELAIQGKLEKRKAEGADRHARADPPHQT
jgi:hypothetical protein